jgi:hypothetical protein
VPTHGVPLLTASFVSAGDDPDRCRRSVEHGWKKVIPPSRDDTTGAPT